jgi:hypothetical protein
VRLVAARGGRLYVKGSVAVVTALEVVADGARFWFQVPSKKTVWTGPATSGAKRDVDENAPYEALRPRDVTTALMPEPLAPGPDDALLLEAEPEAFVLTLGGQRGGRGLVRRRVWMQRDSLIPLRLAAYDERGDLESVADLGITASGSRRYVIRRPREGYEAELVLDKAVFNQPVPPQAFVPRTPEGYAVVEVP